MNKILFSIYTGEYPNQFAGGPNNIIYKIISEFQAKKIQFDYSSYDLYFNNIKKEDLLKIENSKTQIKKTASYLRNNYKLYKKLTTSDFYLPIHFFKKELYFNRISKSLNNYQILHSHDSISGYYYNSEGTNAKRIMTIHSKGPLSDELCQMPKCKYLQNRINRKYKLIEKKNIELSDIITFPSNAAKEYFEKSLKTELPNEKVKIIYNGIDLEYINSIKKDDNIFNRYSIDVNNRIVILNIAAHSPEKNINKMIRIQNELVKKYTNNFLLINIGDQGIKFDYQKVVNELGLSKDIIFLGLLPNDEVIKFLKASDIFLMTSEKVIFDLVVLEALACGACCILSNDGGNKEIIVDGENGYLVDINEIEKIVEKIVSIDVNKTKDNAILSANQFSVGKMVKNYFDLYEGLINGI